MYVEICLSSNKEVSDLFVAGETITGVIKYKTRRKITFNSISLRLVGVGEVTIKDKFISLMEKIHWRGRSTSSFKETYEIVELVLKSMDNGFIVNPGSHIEEFTLTVPKNIPPSFNYLKSNARYNIKCKITHKLKVMFKEDGLLGETVKEKKEIYIISGSALKLPDVPLIYGSQKKITQFLNCKQRTIDLKGKIEKSVVRPGDEILFSYQLNNDSHLRILKVRTRVMEVYIFKATTLNTKIYRKLDDAEWITNRIERLSDHSEAFSTTLPDTAFSVNYAKVVKKYYCVIITAVLPCPRKNLVLEIPITVDPTADESILDMENKFSKYFLENLVQKK